MNVEEQKTQKKRDVILLIELPPGTPEPEYPEPKNTTTAAYMDLPPFGNASGFGL